MVLRPVFKCHSKYTGFGADWAGSAPIRRPYWNEPGSVAHGFELAGSSQRISFRTQLQCQGAACEFIQESQKIKTPYAPLPLLCFILTYPCRYWFSCIFLRPTTFRKIFNKEEYIAIEHHWPFQNELKAFLCVNMCINNHYIDHK